jgi:lysine 2,3-aminomutase
VRKGIEIIRALRGHTTGYAVPQYVIDAPGGGGKVPINPDYVEKITDTEVVFRNYEGQQFSYPLTHTPRPAGNEGELSVVGAPEPSAPLAHSTFKD